MAQVQEVQTGGDPNPVDSTGLCLLSLDGGGVRGLSTLFILKMVMQRLNQERQNASLPPAKPCEIFDLIGGTSTGGLIAIMLGRLRMDVDECIAAYVKLTSRIFESKQSTLPFGWRGHVKAQFDAKTLKSAILEVMANYGAGESDPFIDPLNKTDPTRCKVFVSTTAKENSGTIRLRSYSVPDELDLPATIWEAALATSAATGFFEPVTIGTRKFVDGALGANNPVEEVEGEAMNIWCGGQEDLKSLVKCFISIGTGDPGTNPIEDKLFRFLTQTLVGIATQTESTERKFIARWAKHFDEKRYFRFNVQQGLQGVGLEEYLKQGEIEAATQNYLSHTDQKHRVRDCVGNLAQKKYKTQPDFAEFVRIFQIQTIQEQASSLKPSRIISLPFGRNTRFVGRETQLEQLEHLLSVEDHHPNVAITGLGGIGKTQLALELAYRTGEKCPDCSIFWVPALSIESLQREYLQISRQLRLRGSEDDKIDARKLLKDYLCDSKSGQWLLVFDNVDDMDMWFGKSADETELHGQDFVPWSSKGSVLFTTRFTEIASRLAMQNVVKVPEMDERKAKALFQSRLINQDISYGDGELELLLQQLAYLPLAIVQAASYINANFLTAISDYRMLLAEQEEEVIDLSSERFKDEWRPDDEQNSVATTWLISFERIKRSNPLAAEWMSFMACLESLGIPESLLPPAPSRKKYTEALGALGAYSFVTGRPAEKSLDLHRLVHLAMRNWLIRKDSLSESTLKALRRLSEVFPRGEHDKRSEWRSYMPHALTLVGRSETYAMPERYELSSKMASCLLADGRLEESVVYSELKAQWDERQYDEDHPARLDSQHALGKAYHANGQIEQSVKILEHVVGVRERIFAAENEDRLWSQYELAVAYKANGQIQRAVKLFEHVVRTRERTLHEDHNALLTSRHALAWAYQATGQIKPAVKLLESVVAVRERTLDKENPGLLISQHELGMACRQDWQLKRSVEIFEHVVAIREKTLDEEHPQRLLSQHALAWVYQDYGRVKQAVKLLEHVVQTREKMLAPEHPDRLSSEHELGRVYSKDGQNQRAVELLEHVVAIRTKTLNPEHPDLLVSQHILAMAYKANRQIVQALDLFEKEVAVQRRTREVEHPARLWAEHELAMVYQAMGKTKQALEIMEHVAAVRTRTLEAGNPARVWSQRVLEDFRRAYQAQGT